MMIFATHRIMLNMKTATRVSKPGAKSMESARLLSTSGIRSCLKWPKLSSSLALQVSHQCPGLPQIYPLPSGSPERKQIPTLVQMRRPLAWCSVFQSHSDFTGADKDCFVCGYTDLRRGIDGLASMVQESF